MPRTHLGSLLRRLQAEAEYARRIGLPAADAHDVMQEMSRRRFLKGSIGLGAATLLPALGCSSENTAPGGNVASGTGLRVAVVGAGLAGLTCAHRLVRAGANVTVYEASDRLGGRTRTVRGFFGDNRTAESGAEFVNSDHAAIRALIQELGLELEDLWTGYPEGADSVNSFDKAPYSRTDIANDWSAVAPAVRRDYAAAGTDIRWDNHTDAAIGLDRMSLAQWIDANVPDGRPSRMGRLIEITQLSEWAGSAEHQSALNFITTVGPGAGGAIDLLGGSDERWHVIGGSDRVAERLGEQIGPAAIQLGARLAAARTNGAGVRCTFDQAGSPFDVDADRVVLAVPFSTLRAVDLDGVQLSDRKRRVIADQPMGTNSKLHMEFGERAWRNDGADGDSISDTGLMVTWEGVITEPGPTGVLVAYNGGALGASHDVNVAHAEAQPAILAARRPNLETVFGPATAAAATGRGWLDSWVHDPFVGGSYSYWGIGQYTELRGAGGTPEGPLHFCGEHTSLEHQGFMNGAVETGERAAAEILGR